MSRERFNTDWYYLAKKLGYPSKHAMLVDLYVTQGLSLQQIGDRLGCTPHCISRNLIKEEIDRRSKGGKNNPSNQTRKLFLLDQRIIISSDFTLVARAAGVSTSLLYHYRRGMRMGAWTSASYHQKQDSTDTAH